ncbi:hypothetical protein [Bradyrhizobium sp. SZCCHNR1070]|uniref:hypothetical protein n=1 Tax=Bradyrhizobium sp. SZCCHNR1070 TaxID=3057361 RepID=UPI0029162676|nr:hypothetical protein [Bradyrhizobium sp. SZCCHNR1070]
MYGDAIVVPLYVLLAVAAALNPILAFVNGNKGRLSKFILATGLLSAVGTATLFWASYHNGAAIKALAIIGAAHGASAL